MHMYLHLIICIYIYIYLLISTLTLTHLYIQPLTPMPSIISYTLLLYYPISYTLYSIFYTLYPILYDTINIVYDIVDPSNPMISNGAVFRSTDSGNTWTRSYPPMSSPASSRPLAFTALATNTGGDRVAAAAGRRLFLSTNGGSSWLGPLRTSSNRNITALTVTSYQSFLFACTPSDGVHIFDTLSSRLVKSSLPISFR